MAETIKLVIGVPTTGTCAMQFAFSLVNLMNYLAGNGIKSRPGATIEVTMDSQVSSVIPTNREQIAKRAVDGGKTHLLFLDHDMEFEPNILDGMFGRLHPIVVTNYLIKSEKERAFVAVGLDGKRVETTEKSTGLMPVCYSGFGVSLFETRVFEKIAQPWFAMDFTPETSSYTTEDNPFFRRAREAGFDVLLDHDASKLITGHVGLHAWAWNKLHHYTGE